MPALVRMLSLRSSRGRRVAPEHAVLPGHRHQGADERAPGLADHGIRCEPLVDAREPVVQRAGARRLLDHPQGVLEARQHGLQAPPEIEPDRQGARDQQPRQGPRYPGEGEQAEHEVDHRRPFLPHAGNPRPPRSAARGPRRRAAMRGTDLVKRGKESMNNHRIAASFRRRRALGSRSPTRRDPARSAGQRRSNPQCQPAA